MPYMPQQMQQNYAQFGQQQQSQRGQMGNQTGSQIGPAALIPIGMSLGGAVMGGLGGNDKLSWEEIQKMFGSKALVGQTENLYRMMQQSPMYNNMMQGAQNQASQYRNRLSQNLGGSGLGGSPMAGLSKAASLGYGSQLQRQGQQQLFAQSMQQAMQQMQLQAQMFGQQQQMPNFWQQMGGALMGGGAQGFAGMATG